MLLGCIGDDFTGSSDLANTLARRGMRAAQYCGVPDGPADPSVEAGVVALKSRTIAPDQAVAQSLAALDWLRAQGCRQFFFKYCSTFDSTPDGNIGPVAGALIAALGADRVVVCPAFPAAGRSVYQGHLFVGDRLLSETGMRDHPLTPMTDPDLRRWLGRQTPLAVGLIGAATVLEGADAIRAALDAQPAPLVVVDAIRDADLMAIGAAAAGLTLVTGGSGVAMGLPENFRREGLLAGGAQGWTGAPGPCAILSGSCSETTRAQIARHAAANPALKIDVDKVIAGETTAAEVAHWLIGQSAAPGAAPLAYSSADPAAVKAAQARHGREAAAAAVEMLFAEAARLLVAGGVTRLITAGGETSGAVVEGLGLTVLEIGPEIAPGVPALKAGALALALKSGNFGDADFFAKAARALAGA